MMPTFHQDRHRCNQLSLFGISYKTSFLLLSVKLFENRTSILVGTAPCPYLKIGSLLLSNSAPFAANQ